MNYPNALKSLREQLETTYQQLYRIQGAIQTIEQLIEAEENPVEEAPVEETTEETTEE